MNRFFPLLFFALLAAVPVAEGQWYLLNSPSTTALIMSGKNFIAGTHNGIFISTDTGLSWTLANANIPGQCPTCGTLGVEVNTLFPKGNMIYAGTTHGIYSSTDDGGTWDLLDELPNVITFASIGNFLIAGTLDSGAYRSTDNGTSWYVANNGLTIDTEPFISLSVNALASHGSCLFCSLAHYSIGLNRTQGIFISTDSGLTWSPRNNGLHDTTSYVLDYAKLVFSIIFSGDTGYAGTGSGLFISTDNGLNWIERNGNLSTGDYDGDADCLIFSGNYLFKGNELGGIYRTSNSGISWEKVSAQIFPTQFYLVGGIIYSINYFGGSIFMSIDDGTTWEALGNEYLLDPPIIESGGALFAFDGIGFTISHDSGLSWQRAQGNLSSVPDISAIHVNSFFENGGIFHAGTDTGLFILRDTGWIYSSKTLPLKDIQSWTTIGSDIFAGGISSVYVPNQNPRYPGYTYLTSSGIFQSSDNGNNWREIVNYLASGDSIWNVSLGSSGNTLFANYKYTTDFGVSWNADSVVPNFNAISGTTVFGSDSGNVFISTNAGVNWTKILTGTNGQFSVPWATNGNTLFMQDPDDSSLAADYETIVLNSNGSKGSFPDYGKGSLSLSYIYPADGYLYGIGSLGLWRRPLSNFGISSVASQPSTQQNISSFPNPFSTRTQISFTASESGYAEISVVSALGAEAAQLFAGELNEGNHSFAFDGSNLMDGNYWCVVRMNGRVETLPLAILR